jgi:hypothetical protein
MTTEMWIIAAFRVGSALPVLRWPLAGAFIAVFADLFDLFLRDWLDYGGVKDYQTFDKRLDQAYMLTFLIVALRWQPVPRNIAVALFAFRLVGFVKFELTEERWVLILFPNAFEYWFIFVAALKTFGWEQQPAGSQGRAAANSGGSGTQPARAQRWEAAHAPQARPIRDRQLSLTVEAPSSRQPSDLRPLPSDLSPLSSRPLIGPFLRFAIPYRYSLPQLAVAFALILAAKLFHEYTLHVGQWFEGFTPTEALQAIWGFLSPPY